MKLESTVAVAAMPATTETPKRKRSGYLLEASWRCRPPQQDCRCG